MTSATATGTATARPCVGLVGLGLMGSAMARRLQAAGYTVHAYDISSEAVGAHAARGGVVHATPAAVAAACSLTLLSLPNAAIARDVCLGPTGIREGAAPGTVIIDTTTASPDDATNLAAALADSSIVFLDAALSGTSEMVADGEALAMVGGSPVGFTRVRPILESFSREVIRLGGVGSGMRAKLIVNHVLALNRFALAEALVVAEKAEMDLDQVLHVLRSSAAQSRAIDMWGRRMIDRRYDEPASRLAQHDKDARLILDMARGVGAPTLAMSQLNHLVRIALANGWGQADNAAIVETIRAMAGLRPLAADAEDAPTRS